MLPGLPGRGCPTPLSTRLVAQHSAGFLGLKTMAASCFRGYQRETSMWAALAVDRNAHLIQHGKVAMQRAHRDLHFSASPAAFWLDAL